MSCRRILSERGLIETMRSAGDLLGGFSQELRNEVPCDVVAREMSKGPVNHQVDRLAMTTPANTMFDWLHTGRVYVRAQLAGSALGLRFHPLSQVLQEYPQMDELRSELDALLGVEPPTKIQMLVRVGRTATPGLSPRRALDELLV